MGSCNKCAGENEVKVTGGLDGHAIMSADTKCKDCGFEDSWDTGWFESGQNMISNCRKYSF